jgi:two-component system invasion response regulator UvrY
METKKILIADDHSTVRIGIKMLLSDLFSRVDIHTVVNFKEVLDVLTVNIYDLIILDINIPGGDNLEMIASIRQKQSNIPILIFSGYDEQMYALRYMEAGANGFLSKDASDEEHKIALKAVLNNGRYISSRVQERLLFSAFDRTPINPFENLSPREMQIMLQLAEGKWTKEIATNLNLKLSTISTYKARIFEKLEVNNSIELFKKLDLYRKK